MVTFDALYDGEALRPEGPVALPQNVRLRVTVVESPAQGQEREAADREPDEPLGLFERIIREHGLVEGPEDWSSELDHYLYGTPKRGHRRAD
jgi:hypothetical protein